MRLGQTVMLSYISIMYIMEFRGQGSRGTESILAHVPRLVVRLGGRGKVFVPR
jgi:hypothetical protein